MYSIKKGDIVIIPTASSNILHFGEVKDSITYLKNEKDECPHLKRKKVKWIKSESKYRLDAEIYKLTFSHNTISDANEYAVFIDRTLNDFFIKGDSVHLVLNVKTKNKIPVSTFYDFGEIFRLNDSFCKQQHISIDGDFSVKSKVQSEGILEIIYIGSFTTGIVSLGLILQSLAGGKISINIKANKEGLDIKVDSDIPKGIIEQVSDSLSKNRADKLKADIVKKCLENMDVLEPDDLKKMIEKFGENN